MSSSHGRSVAIAVFVFVLTFSPYAHAADASAFGINDPFTDAIQLWSAALSSIDSLAHQIASALQLHEALTFNRPAPSHAPKNLQQPAALAASAALATQSPPETATTSGSASDSSTTSQQPQTTSPPEATSHQTTQSPFVKSPDFSPKPAAFSPPSHPAPAAAPASAFVTQTQFNAAMSALGASVRQLLTHSNPNPVPEYVGGDGNNLYPYAAASNIGQLSNVTINNPTITGLTSGEIPDLSGSYLSLGGGMLTGAFVDSGGASSSFAGALGIGTTSPSDVLAVNGPIFLGSVSPAATADRLYNSGGSLYWAGSPIAGGSVGNWTTDGTNVWRSGGNVGIGTSSPNVALDVIGNETLGMPGGATRILTLNNSSPVGGANQNLTISSALNQATINAINQPLLLTSWDPVSISTVTANSPIVLSPNGSGGVGIGTTTPYSRLSVWGPDTSAGTSAFVIANSASTTEFNVLDNGNATLAGTLAQNSDQRLKTNIQSLDASSSLVAIDELNPVTFNWLDLSQGSTTQLGFIAQQVQPIFPNLVSTTSATALTPNGTLSVNYIGLISPIVAAIQALSAELSSIENTIAGFAQSFSTHQLCLSDANGTSCYTRSQLDAAVAAASVGQSPAAEGSSSSSDGAAASSSTDSSATPPVLQVNGDNPAIIQVGTTYTDLGATIEGPQADLNLGVTMYVNGTLMNPVQIDTSTAATDTIAYVATDQSGLTATSTRTVIIEAAPSIVPSAAASSTATSSTP